MKKRWGWWFKGPTGRIAVTRKEPLKCRQKNRGESLGVQCRRSRPREIPNVSKEGEKVRRGGCESRDSANTSEDKKERKNGNLGRKGSFSLKGPSSGKTQQRKVGKGALRKGGKEMVGTPGQR